MKSKECKSDKLPYEILPCTKNEQTKYFEYKKSKKRNRLPKELLHRKVMRLIKSKIS